MANSMQDQAISTMEAEINALDSQVQELKAKKLELHGKLDQMNIAQDVTRKLGNMSLQEREMARFLLAQEQETGAAEEQPVQ